VTARQHALALTGICALFAVVATWNIGQAGYSDFYSTAARSMSVSWPAFFSGAFDPSATITLDKLAGFLVPQALSARLIGFSQASLALPQVLEGLVTLVAVDRIAARWRGPAAGILAAGAFATTPLMVSTAGHVMEDGLVTMCLALAFLAVQRAATSGRILPVVLGAVLVGAGFQAKMLQAWFVLPALVVLLLACGRWSWRARLGRAGLFVGVALLASLGWMVAFQLVPAGHRPYADGSTDDSVFAMVLGYNGVDRFVAGLVPGAAPQFVGAVVGSHSIGASPLKLLLPEYTTQIGWAYPLALVGIVLTWRAGRGARPVLVALTVWLATAAGILTVTTVPHTAYLAALAVPLTALAGAGLVEAWRRGRRALAAVVAAEGVWTAWILVSTRIAPVWLMAGVGVLVAGAVAALLLSAPRDPAGTVRSRGAARTRWCHVLVAGAVLVAPAVWTGSTVDLSLAGSANDAYGGPRIDDVGFFFQAPGSRVQRMTFDDFAVAPPVWTSPGPTLTVEQRHLVDYVRPRVRAGAPLLTAGSWDAASPYILAAGLDVRSLGGFSGAVPSPTLAEVRADVRSGQRRFFLLPTEQRGSGATAAGRIRVWVRDTCTLVPDDAYEGATTLAGQTLYDCR
jgi:4-amino-4-deoxy-L-arabinose transferase-like glycosyltransferase